MRKFRIIFAFALAAIICLSVSGAAMAEDPQYNYYLFRKNNFTLTGEWQEKYDADTFPYYIPGDYLRGTTNTSKATTKIYVPDEGDYNVWILAWNYSGDAEYRSANVLIDSENIGDDYIPTTSENQTWKWEKNSEPVHLTAGEHTLDVSVKMPSFCFTAVFVTNDLDYILNTETMYDDISVYEDGSAPTINSTIEVVTEGATTLVATFPTATDNVGVSYTAYYLNDKEIVPEADGTYRAEGIMPLSRNTFTMKAYDAMGNSDEETKSINLCDWEIASCTMTDIAADEPIESLSEISADCTSVKLSFTVNKYLTGMQRTPIFAGIYTKEENRMVAKATGTALAIGETASPSVTIALPDEVKAAPQNYIVKAILIDSDNITPKSTVTVFEEEVSE